MFCSPQPLGSRISLSRLLSVPPRISPITDTLRESASGTRFSGKMAERPLASKVGEDKRLTRMALFCS